MQNQGPDRRREPRYYVGAPAVLRRPGGVETYSAVALNASSGGILLQLTGTQPFQVGDEVMCELALPDSAEQPLASWGIGRVIRVDNGQAAIELDAGTFSQ